MDAERVRGFLLGLPHVMETVQWGGRLVYWVGDKAIGGKIFAVVNLDGTGRVISYCAGRERFAELVENEGVDPAPYMARNFWVAVDGWGVFRTAEWEQELTAAHETYLRQAASANEGSFGDAAERTDEGDSRAQGSAGGARGGEGVSGPGLVCC